MDRRVMTTRLVLSAAFLSMIPAANWSIGHVGTVCIAPGGPCLVPVAPGLLAPSGSLLIGVALVLRNFLQLHAPRIWILGCIAIGAVLSAFVAPGALVVASAAAFTLGELADWAVFSPLRRRHMTKAVIAAGATGAVVDALVFIFLAFGAEWALVPGQVLAKIYASLLAAAAIRGQHWLKGRTDGLPGMSHARVRLRPSRLWP